ncbi:hypothetical protein [Tepidibacter formicigenes]|jgi:hypothetical protein|uniref:Uncharacterized protein n=1 Tax=Tepidibacter formicigenes DSM 15518 TaxID=1123349 RepID=A0A1M6RJM0_9FIRM|nr:hypothetical protein [Tepidibacter formicigenes]SHK32619.1 hypothetical protein SAMN02744037_02124 [Tepidibacter formicigenes DSM 15518]
MSVGKVGIEQILEVVHLTKNKVANGQSVTEARVEATHDVSKSRGVNFSTIEDKYIRGLDETISGNVGLKGAEEFDKALEDSINQKNTKLRNILLSRTNEINLQNSIMYIV